MLSLDLSNFAGDRDWPAGDGQEAARRPAARGRQGTLPPGREVGGWEEGGGHGIRGTDELNKI